MRFKTGSKVEVLNTRDSPCGSWWTAEIISGNGHYYNVIYDICPPHMGKNIVERVSRKSIRPCPPVQCNKSWASGDYVELFHAGSWNQSVVTLVVDSYYYLVRIFGSFKVFKVHSSQLRSRQLWQDPDWILMGKNCSNFDGGRLSKNKCKKKPTFPMFNQGINFLNNVDDDHVPSLNSTNIVKPHAVPCRGAKRYSEFYLSPQKRPKSTGNIREVSKDGIRHQQVAGPSSGLFDKVDAVASPPIILGETYMHTPCNRTGYSETNGGEKPKADVKCIKTRRLKSYNAENDASSACSSSGSNSIDVLGGSSLDLDDSNEDNHNFGVSKNEKGGSNQQKFDVDAEIHKVELHAYRSTIDAFYASGPLSWEQEALITNLRLMLNISNDEHLYQLRQLKSLA